VNSSADDRGTFDKTWLGTILLNVPFALNAFAASKREHLLSSSSSMLVDCSCLTFSDFLLAGADTFRHLYVSNLR
jgi:hypothetical protein